MDKTKISKFETKPKPPLGLVSQKQARQKYLFYL
jgi:hypothetical protein